MLSPTLISEYVPEIEASSTKVAVPAEIVSGVASTISLVEVIESTPHIEINIEITPPVETAAPTKVVVASFEDTIRITSLLRSLLSHLSPIIRTIGVASTLLSLLLHSQSLHCH